MGVRERLRCRQVAGLRTPPSSAQVAAVSDLVFEVIQEADGGFCAQCLSDSIVTEGNTWEELRANVREVVKAFYFDQPDKLPSAIRLHLVRDEVLACRDR